MIVIRTIIFDYAGVITPTRNKSALAQLHHSKFGLTPDKFLDILYKDWDKAAVNEITTEEYWKRIAQKLNIGINEIRQMIMEAFPIESRIINLISKLKEEYVLIMMSNQIEDWLEEVIDDNKLRDKFDYFANSYQVKISKPDKRIFLYALKQSQSKAEETLFIDDSEININAASELGLETIRFENFEQFINELRAKLNRTEL